MVVDESLEIANAFRQLAQFLVSTGLIMKLTYNNISGYRLTTARSILQDSFRLVEIDQRLARLKIVNALLRTLV